MFLPDVNVWLGLAFRGHAHHPRAKEWFEQVPVGGCSFCRVTQQGFLRLASNPSAFGKDAVSLLKAWGKYDALLNDPRVLFTEEPAHLESHWRTFTMRRTFSPNLFNDAYVAAFAKAAGFEVVSFDSGLAQFKGVQCTILS